LSRIAAVEIGGIMNDMNSKPADVFDAAMGLSDRQRAALAYRLLQSLEPAEGASADDEFQAEIQRRLAKYEAEAAESHDSAECAAAERKPYTHTQGQYLAFIYTYTKLNGRPPAEADIQRYFQVSPPSVHNMIKMLTKKRLIDRRPGVPRSITLRLAPDQLPELD
jgi:putative addiction module component (TIGR02574 family)